MQGAERQPKQSTVGKSIIILFSGVEQVIYVLIGLALIVIAAFSLVAVSQDMIAHLASASNAALIALQDIFTTIIVAELLLTVVGYLKTRTINLRLILGAGLTAMVRRLLVIGIEPLTFEELVIIVVATAVLAASIKVIGEERIYT
ncbi:MAG: phosphate-starvation-inducible PsiE family protein [Halobacteriota archaeon]